MVKFHKIATNKRAKFDYQIEDTVLAGIVLFGHEVKSVRSGSIQLKGSFAQFMQNELWLVNAFIAPYPKAKVDSYEPTRSRKLLLHKRQLDQLAAAKQSGKAIAVLSMGLSGNYIKVELGIGRGKKSHDKRQAIKQREADREAHRVIKTRNR